jgi:hypothetical protein
MVSTESRNQLVTEFLNPLYVRLTVVAQLYALRGHPLFKHGYHSATITNILAFAHLTFFADKQKYL